MLLAALALTQTFAAHGLTARAPLSWHAVGRPLSECTDPAQRLALVGPRGELVQITERLANPAQKGPRRPRPFRLDTPPGYVECCAPRDAKGWFFAWVEGRRELYAYAYTGRGSREDVERVLNSLVVAPRR